MKKIGAHNGMFHCDEALACFMLKQLPEYKEAEVIRFDKSHYNQVHQGWFLLQSYFTL